MSVRSLMLIGVITALMTGANGAVSSENSCSAAFGTKIDAGKVGLIRPGMTVSEFKKYCPSARIRTELDAEAIPMRVIRLRAPDPIVRLNVDNGRLRAIGILDPNIVDNRGVNVGEVIAPGADRNGLVGSEGDGRLYLEPVNECTLAYRTDYEPGDTEHKAKWLESDLQKIAAIRVEEIIIISC